MRNPFEQPGLIVICTTIGLIGPVSVATAHQFLRKAPAVPDACGTPDGFNNLGGATSWINSLSASVSNGLRNTLKFEGAAFAASL